VNIEMLKADLKRFRGQDISFAGIVTGPQHKQGKNGKPFGSFLVEDYTDSISLFLYSEDYLKYRHLLVDGMFVFLKARVESRFDAPDQMVIRISSMVLLSDVMEKYSKGVTVTIRLQDLTPDNIGLLMAAAKKHKGKASLRIRVEDREERTTVDLPSKKFKVNPREMITSLSVYPDFEVKLLHE